MSLEGKKVFRHRRGNRKNFASIAQPLRQYSTGLKYQAETISPTGDKEGRTGREHLATQVVWSTAGETCFSPAAPRALWQPLYDWEEEGDQGGGK